MRRRLLTVLLCFVMLGATGCSGDSGEKKEEGTKAEIEETEEEKQEAEGEEYITWIEEAWEEYKSSDIRGFVDTKYNGSQSEFNTFDTGKQQWMMVEHYNSEDAEGTDKVKIRIQEGEKDYIFKTQRTGEDTYDNLKVMIDPSMTDEESYSEYMKKESKPLFESDDEKEVSNITATQEEEEINGIKAVKIDISYETIMKSGEKFTRESVLEERGWSEEEIRLLSDFRLDELIDAYVGVVNAEIESRMSEPANKHITYYLSSDDHKLLRSVEIVSSSDGPELPYELNDMLSQLKSSLKNGESEEEAVQWVKELYGDYYSFDGMMESMLSQDTSGIEIIRDYQTGDGCEPMCEIPADAKEITWEQWMRHDF